jgi:hypothetical protein
MVRTQTRRHPRQKRRRRERHGPEKKSEFQREGHGIAGENDGI